MRHLLVSLCLILVACGGSQQARVVSVVDGDTFVAALPNGAQEHVRIVGIDTPETVDPRKAVQCFGPEASAQAKELLFGKSVVLVKKPDEDRDRYGRLLRYVELDGRDVGAELIGGGYAKNYPYFPHPRLGSYAALEDQAKAEGRGLWSACAR